MTDTENQDSELQAQIAAQCPSDSTVELAEAAIIAWASVASDMSIRSIVDDDDRASLKRLLVSFGTLCKQEGMAIRKEGD